ncbi:MAG: hypothetical protein WD226_14645 [Planctomycetota bacterium]
MEASLLRSIATASVATLLTCSNRAAQGLSSAPLDAAELQQAYEQRGSPRSAGQDVDGSCAWLRFDGTGDNQPLGSFVLGNGVTVTFGPGWLSLVDLDDGGTGRFANEPSSPAIAYFLNASLAWIDLSTPVAFVSVAYSASALSVPVTLAAWDGPAGTGNQVASTSGNVIGTSFDGAACSGDPTGEFCGWAALSVQTNTPQIRSLTLVGGLENQIGFDDLEICFVAPCPVPASVTVLADPGNRNVPDSLFAASGSLPVIGNQDFRLRVDNPTGGCGVATGSFTQIFLTPGMLGNATLAGAGCDGGLANLFVDLAGSLSSTGVLPWNGQPVTHVVPIPANVSLCGFDCTAQAVFFGPATNGARLSNGLLLTVGQ